MTPAEHYAEGERILGRVSRTADQHNARWEYVAAMAGIAQAHFLAALAAPQDHSTASTMLIEDGVFQK